MVGCAGSQTKQLRPVFFKKQGNLVDGIFPVVDVDKQEVLLFDDYETALKRSQNEVVDDYEIFTSNKEMPLAKGSSSVREHAAHALSIIHKQTLSKDEADQVMNETVHYWKKHVNEGFLKYRKSVADGGNFAALDWTDPYPGSALFCDARGSVFIDCLGGFGIFNVGRRHPVVVQAVESQLRKQALHSQELLDPLRAYCAHLLSMLMPGQNQLTHCFFTNSGTESVEACLKMAYMSTGRKHILATVNAFHGKTLGALATTSKSAFRKPFLGVMSNVSHVPFNDLNALRAAFEASKFTGNEIAGLILEPIQGEGGIYVGSDDYLKGARQLCDEYGACLIFDEVQSGMGRTGKWFACEWAGVVPDIMAIGKAFGGGVMPAGACVASAKVWEKYIENPFLFTTTFGGNPLAMAAAIATINVIIEENLLEAAAQRGEEMKSGLLALKLQFPDLVADVRGRGLMLGIEFTSNDIGVDFSRGMFARNVLVSGTLVNAKVVRIEPPLTIRSSEIQTVLERAKQVLLDIRAPKQMRSKL
eukprot:TRINITY_DN2256_c0_g1_i2.p1 TRINITY_DN2256_c0_g1~~TRINITY_DN2256_c0_g1_i2.p1  ORF type:complete len:531 (-),score=124.74 TRINITY_DN2256_c0_g1_i2:68-1660(-)